LIELDKGKQSKRQKGFTQRQLCDTCEGKFGAWESYFASLWFNPKTRARPTVLSGAIIQIPGLDYARFKLFHLSIIWRAGISSLEIFAAVTLGPHEAKIRQRLLQSDPGTPNDYPFFGIGLRDPSTGGFQDSLIISPSASKVQGHRVYSLCFGGVIWHYFISGHPAGNLVPVYFGLDGLLTLGVQDWTKNIVIQDFAARYQAKQRSRA
jgi:hypothetical protein